LATFSVWDIKTHGRVWSGQVAGKSTATHTLKANEAPGFSDLGLGDVGKVLDVIAGVDDKATKDAYPETPGLNEVTPLLFRNFAKALSAK